MTTTTIFLARPAGVRITTRELPRNVRDSNPQQWLLLDSITVVNERGHDITIPTENIASVEVAP